MQTVGFIGLGAMGQGMARNLVHAGYTVRGYDVRAEALAAADADGVIVARSPAEAARDAELLVVVVFTAEQAEQVLFGEHGALETLPTGATVLMDTTMSPAQAQALETRLAESGHRMLDAPVTGGVAGADAGSLTFIVSGSREALAAARSAMTVMGDKIAECGDHAGPGSTVKMINQLMCGVMMAASAEAITLAAKAGADPRVVLDVIASGVARSPLWESQVGAILARDYGALSVVDILTKDLDIVLEAGKDLSFPLPLAATAMQQYVAADAIGRARGDDRAVIKVYEALADIDVADQATDA